MQATINKLDNKFTKDLLRRYLNNIRGRRELLKSAINLIISATNKVSIDEVKNIIMQSDLRTKDKKSAYRCDLKAY